MSRCWRWPGRSSTSRACNSSSWKERKIRSSLICYDVRCYWNIILKALLEDCPPPYPWLHFYRHYIYMLKVKVNKHANCVKMDIQYILFERKVTYLLSYLYLHRQKLNFWIFLFLARSCIDILNTQICVFFCFLMNCKIREKECKSMI